ncbi:hypothetical protein [Archangium sp.]|jgi:hypothetical protein|uniref:hypothetical protein n=1 Tax=Archangium sp. TaxID=1872627 RepID=UPI002EDA650B
MMSSNGKKQGIAFIFAAVATLVGCGGTEGVDTTTPSADEAAYLDELFPSWSDVGSMVADSSKYQYREPPVPIMVDGQLRPAASIKEFNGRPLVFLANAESTEGGFLFVFKNPEELRRHLQERGAMPRAQGASDVSALGVNDPSPSAFYTNSGLQGSVMHLSVGSSIYNLTDRPLDVFWTWNDKISSVQATGLGSYTILYEHSGYTGAQFWVARGASIFNLDWHSFNDRTSSIRVVW